MPQQSFIFGGNAPGAISYEEMQRRRELAQSLAGRVASASPSNLGEGLSAIGAALASRKYRTQAAQAESLGRAQAADQFGKVAQQAGFDPSIMDAYNNPYMSEGQKSVVNALVSQKLNPPAPKESYSVLTPEEEIQFGLDPKGTYQRGSVGGKIDTIGGGGTTVNNLPPSQPGYDSDELRKKLDQKEGEVWSTYLEQGSVAGQMSRDMEMLGELSKVAPQGPITGRFAQAFPGFDSAGSAFQSIVKRVAPSLRNPGSGSTSDIEYQGFLQSLPSLQNYPEANAVIAGTLQAKAQIDMERATVIQQYQNGEISIGDARKMMRDIDKRSIMTPELQSLIDGVDPSAAPDQEPIEIFSEEEAADLPPGTVVILNGQRFRIEE
jgi:hypothetical protein